MIKFYSAEFNKYYTFINWNQPLHISFQYRLPVIMITFYIFYISFFLLTKIKDIMQFLKSFLLIISLMISSHHNYKYSIYFITVPVFINFISIFFSFLCFSNFRLRMWPYFILGFESLVWYYFFCMRLVWDCIIFDLLYVGRNFTKIYFVKKHLKYLLCFLVIS